MTVRERAQGYKDYAIAIRREFHMNPEPSMKEYRTSDRIMEELIAAGIECRKVAGTGVIGIIKGNGEGKTIALRADIDALDLQETNEVAYKSKNAGFMHGCGHDGHAAGLLTAAKILKEMSDTFKGQVKLIFQPGEETAKGAKKLIEEGELKDVDGIFGIHLWNDAPVGKISIEAGPRMASAGIFKIYVTGKGGHGSMPHQGVDAVVVGSAIVTNLQSLVSREISPLDPAVLSIGIFNAGTRFNVLAGEAYLEGTTRCFSMEVNDAFEGMMRRVIDNTAATYRATAVLDYEQLVVPTINTPEMSAIGEKAVEALMGREALVTYEKTTGGEDFSYYLKEVPGAFAFVGTKNADKIPNFPHHHPKFDIDEDALEVAAGLYAQYAITYLNE
ncbi:amidohydrolase [Fusibacter ferrireducens]|uniref:Amidohydrolase n=1 Tax=Fusibacter ferrireducens TaxID=2785058 RepID=A0ABR9ZUN8_9FIRM|nr:amidohydrolase [Fusibacter ferrireducens]MBF4694184.1 amidohydrolase [Fusibacter ferrireducens]